MRKFILFISFVLVFVNVKTQVTTITDVKFNNIPAGWMISPTGGWELDYDLYVSSPSSIVGYVPNASGDSVELITPYFDCTNYSNVFLRFSHICKVTANDICKIYIQENHMSSRWKELPFVSYKGATPSAYAGNRFSHLSYSTWNPNDSLATPSNGWWKTELFDLSDDASYAQVRFRFVIKRGNVSGTQFAYGWLIDNFELTASNTGEVRPPIIEDLAPIGDTVYTTGPHNVLLRISPQTIHSIVKPIRLMVRYEYPGQSTVHDTILMTMVEGDTIFSATIPQKLVGTTVSYSVYAYDTIGNNEYFQGSFYIKRPPVGGSTGYVIVGTGTTFTYTLPISMNNNYSWSRQLYKADELSVSSSGGLITKLAWQFAYTGSTTYSNQTCYFEVVDASVTTVSSGYVDPIITGATKVYEGSLSISQGWVEVVLDKPFVLPSGKNLMVYWHNNNGSYPGTAYVFNHTATTNNMAIYAMSNASFPSTSAGTLTLNRPNVRFYMAGTSSDSNSVAMHEIVSPMDSVVSSASHRVPIIVTIKNKGLNNLDSCYINWTLNGVLQPQHVWKGNLTWDFDATDTIGWYQPSLNEFDTIIVWTSYPNGQYDSTTYDDTLHRTAFGVTGLDMKFTDNYRDTVYTTGPFYVTAKIKSRTLQPVPQPVLLEITSTYQGTPTNHTVPMTHIGNDIYACTTPQYLMSSQVDLSVTVQDSVGNDVTISKNFYIQRGYLVSSDSITVGEYSSGGTWAAPFWTGSAMCWTKTVYNPRLLGNRTDTVLINGISWCGALNTNYAVIAPRANQRIYFKAVADTVVTNTAYEDPETEGYTLVWSGGITTSRVVRTWFGVDLQNPFYLPPNHSLMVYMLDSTVNGTPGNNFAFLFAYSPNSAVTTVYYQNSAVIPFTGTTGSSTDYIPLTRFYLTTVNEDSNSVALYSIDSPSPVVEAIPSGSGSPVRVTLRNRGMNSLTTCEVEWTLNGVNQGKTNWSGNLLEGYNDTITIGWYHPTPNKIDTIKAWVQNPNGNIDPRSSDDTLYRFVFGQSGIDADFMEPLVDDTVFYNGPFNVYAKIVSRTNVPLLTPTLKYNYTNINGYHSDSIVMTNMGGDSIWMATIPKNIFGATINYSITVVDSFGSPITISSYCYLQRGASDKITDTIFVGTGAGGGLYPLPFDSRYAYSWSRSMILSSELGNTSDTMTVIKIAWMPTSTAVISRSNQVMYMKAVDETSLDPNNTTFNPKDDDATLVWYGGLTTDGNEDWQEITLLYPFPVPTGKNLLVYFIDSTGTPSPSFAWLCDDAVGMAIYSYDPVIGPSQQIGNIGPYRSYNRVCLGRMVHDENAVGLLSINSPADTILMSPNLQVPVNVTVENKGIANLDSCLIHWSVNGVLQPTVNWYGSLSERYVDTITIGYYTPTAGNSDRIVVWVSMPNGFNDTLSTHDDTLKLNVFAKTGLIAEYVEPRVRDTVYDIGPFEIFAHVKSLTSIPAPRPTMYVSYTFNDVTTYDTILSSIVVVDSLYKVDLPQQPYGTKVTYTMSVVDSMGNAITIADSFYTERLPGGSSTGYVIVGTAATTATTGYSLPMNTLYNYGWSRQLYRADELSSVSSGGLITKLAWQYAYTLTTTYANQTCYFEAVDASTTTITNGAYVNPSTSGVTEVWKGSINLIQGWVEITLDRPFLLLPGKNLVVHWHDNRGSYPGSAYVFAYTTTLGNTAVYAQSDGAFPTTAGTLTSNRPNARFYIIGQMNDSNSVAITEAISPNDTVTAYQNTPIQVVIKNKGMANLTSCYIDWTMNGVAQPRFTWTGNLMEDFSDTVLIGNFTPVQGTTYYFNFEVSMPNNVYDSLTYDDTISCKAYGHFRGVNLTMQQFVEPQDNPNEVCFPNTKAVVVRIANTGTSAIMLGANPITLYYNVNGPVNYMDSLVLSRGIFSVGAQNIVLDTALDISMPGVYDIEVYLSCALDTIHFDDTLRLSYEVRKTILPLDVDFSTMPEDIYVIHYAGDVEWEQTNTSGLSPDYGTGILYFNSASFSGSVSSARLHAINLSETTDPTFEFWFAHDASNPLQNDRVMLNVSVNGGLSFTPITTLYRYDSTYTTPGWKKYTIDISELTSRSCVVFSFDAYSLGGGDMCIDRILITSKHEMGIDIEIPKIDDLQACDLDNEEIRVVLVNNSAVPIDFNQVETILTVEVTGVVTKTYVDTLTGILPRGSVLDVIVDNTFDFTTNGIYDFKAYVNSTDNNTDNDTVTTSISILSDVALVSLNDIGYQHINAEVYPVVKIANLGNVAVGNIPLRLQVDGENDITEVANIKLLAGKDTLYAFQTPYTVPIEPTYTLKITSELSCDNDNSNDTLYSTENVNEPMLKVQSILLPNNTVCDTGLHSIYPQVTIDNTSGVAETDIVIHMILDSNDVVFETFVDTIALVLAGTTNYTFTESYIVPNLETNATYNVTTYIYSPTYALQQTACVVHNDVGIDGVYAGSWYMGQNIPNPATNNTTIEYAVPQEGNVLFKLTTISGQVVYEKELEAHRGYNNHVFNIADLANGIYYYSMEYKGHRLVKKMTIQK